VFNVGSSLLEFSSKNSDIVFMFISNTSYKTSSSDSDGILFDNSSGSNSSSNLLNLFASIESSADNDSSSKYSNSISNCWTLVLDKDLSISSESGLAVSNVSSSSLDNSESHDFVSKGSLVLSVIGSSEFSSQNIDVLVVCNSV
jgi:hypothetical protein